MAWMVILFIGFSVLHFVLFMPTQAAIVGAVILMAGLWIIWKLKWVILGIIGLEELFGNRNDGA